MMKLGMITSADVEGLKFNKKLGLDWAEFDLNVGYDLNVFFNNIPAILEYNKENDMHIGAIGRWGSDRLTANGINEEEFKTECSLVDACQTLSCPVYISNCNPVEGMDFVANCELAAQYLGRLCDYAKTKNVKVCVYNCHWNSIVNCDPAWTIVLGKVPELGIKFDPSHSIAGKRDYLAEMVKWGDRFYHVHLKGSLYVNGEHLDDPPAGIDVTDWHRFMGLLYFKNYDSMLSIEPHSANWTGEKCENGIKFTAEYFRKKIF